MSSESSTFARFVKHNIQLYNAYFIHLQKKSDKIKAL